jgi:hypothetical protein
MELFQASRQWAVRPDDQRFWTVPEMYDACRGYYNSAATARVAWGDLHTEPHNGEVAVMGKAGQPALCTHYAFGQLASLVGAPAAALRERSADLASRYLNECIAERKPTDVSQALFHRNNGDLVLRALTGQDYERVWNWELAEVLKRLTDQGWRTAPARPATENAVRTRTATEQDCGPWTFVQPGETIAPAGLYASDHDLFCFMLHPDRSFDDGNGKPLFRGFFAWNSEVGDKSWGISKFSYEASCGNHIIWGARDLVEFKFRHVGTVRDRIAHTVQVEMRRYANDSISDEQGKLTKARSFVLATTKQDLIEKVFRLRIPSLTRTAIEDSYKAAQLADYDPHTAWGIAQGITRISQATTYADQRTELDRAAGRVLQVAF